MDAKTRFGRVESVYRILKKLYEVRIYYGRNLVSASTYIERLEFEAAREEAIKHIVEKYGKQNISAKPLCRVKN